MDPLLEDFKNYLMARKRGCRVYYFAIRKLFLFCKEKQLNYLKFVPNDLIQFIIWMQQQQYATEYVNKILKATKVFFQFLLHFNLVSEVYVKEVILKNTRLLRVERVILDSITEKEFFEVIEMGMDFIEYFEPIKLRAILYFLFYTGVRKWELINLKRHDINLKECSAIIRIPNKASRERYVYFTEKTSRYLKEYFDLEDEDRNAFNLTERVLLRLIGRLKEFVPGKNITMHSFRRGFADMLSRRGVSVNIICKLLGHSNIETTLRYLNPSEEDVKNIYSDSMKRKSKKNEN